MGVSDNGIHKSIGRKLDSYYDLNQIIEAWEGDEDKGQPLKLTAINDAVNYAVDIRNLDPTNSYGLRVRNASGEPFSGQIRASALLGKNMTVASGVTIDGIEPERTRATGTWDGATLTAASIIRTGSKLFILVNSLKTMLAQSHPNEWG